jgi:type I restriction enzyme S subunit
MHSPELSSTEHTITPAGLKSSSASVIPAGEVIMASRVGLGKASILKEDTAINQDIRALIPKRSNRVSRRFLLYWLQSIAESIVSAGSGATVKGVKLPFIKTLPFPAIRLEEQKRIVAVLDQVFAALDRARAHAEANLADAAKIFENYLAQVFSEGGAEWSLCCVGDVITLQRGFDITKRDQRDGPIPVISSGGAKSFHDEVKVTAPGVVVGRKGSIGSVHFIEKDFWPHDTTLFVKDFKKNSPKLVFYMLRGLKLAEFDTGAANPSLNRNLVHPLRIMWPRSDEQEEVATGLVQVEGAAQELRSQYLSKLAQIADLRQSILQAAFSGRLT